MKGVLVVLLLFCSCAIRKPATKNPVARIAWTLSKAYKDMGNEDSSRHWKQEYKRLKKAPYFKP